MRIFIFLALFLSLNPGALAALSLSDLEGKSDPELAQVFNEKLAENKSNLGKQCLVNNAEELAAVENQVTDPDLKMTDEDFQKYLNENSIMYAQEFMTAPAPETVCYLNKKEYFAIRTYTGSFYRQLNEALRNHNKEALKKYRIFIKFLDAGLKKLKPYTDFVKRGSSFPVELVKNHVKGAEINFESFTSTSIRSGFGGNIRYVFLSQGCRYVAPFSKYVGEEEVLCPAGTIFKVLFRNEVPGGVQLLMAEISQSLDIDKMISDLP